MSTDATTCAKCGGEFSRERVHIDGSQYHPSCALVSWPSHTHEDAGRMSNQIVRLRTALQSQWEANHYEHCGHEDCVSFGGTKLCHWPRPIELDDLQQNQKVAEETK